MPARPEITHVDFGNDYGKVHRLREPVAELVHATGKKTACGRTYHSQAFSAGWHNYDESRHGFCSRCKGVLDRARPA